MSDQKLKNKQDTVKQTKQVKVPHTYVIIFFVIIACWLLTFLVPVGKYDTHKVEWTNDQGKTKSKTVLMSETFRYQYELDNGKLKTNLEALIKDEVKLTENQLEKEKLEALLIPW